MSRSIFLRALRLLARSIAGLLLLAVIAYAIFTGPRNLERYPEASASPYRLPWATGITCWCIQGNRAVVSHRELDEFAYDFAMESGSDVCAARAGVVKAVEDRHDGNGVSAPNNYVAVRHADGTTAWYLHLRKGGSRVKVGDPVEQGQIIAASGNVGRSIMPHLHFHVRDSAGDSMPVTFSDVPADQGIPRMFKRYTAGEKRPPVP